MPSAPLELAGPWTFDDLAALPGDGRRYEVVDGSLLVSPPSSDVVSATSTGMDRVLKPTEYAAAGVPFYWRVELEPTVHVVAHRLEDGAYAEVGRLEAGRGVLPGPWDVLVDVAALA